MDTPRCIHLVLNPYTRMPYLQHTHEVDERTIHRLKITTTLPSTGSLSMQPRRRPMMRITTHVQI